MWSHTWSASAAGAEQASQSTQSSFATVVAEEAAKLHAQLGQDAVDVPMMENGPDDVPSEEAEREHLRTLLANLDASIAARGCGGGRERVPDSTDQAKEAQAGPGSALGRQTAQDEAQSGPRGLRRQTRRWSRRLLAKQKLTQQAKEARDAKAKELEEVEAEARTAREGSAQSARNSSSRSPSPNESSAVGGRTTECTGRRSEGELQPMARAIMCPGAVPASTTARPNAGGVAVAPFATKRYNCACRGGGAQCRDTIDRERRRRRRWATFSARVEIPTI